MLMRLSIYLNLVISGKLQVLSHENEIIINQTEETKCFTHGLLGLLQGWDVKGFLYLLNKLQLVCFLFFFLLSELYKVKDTISRDINKLQVKSMGRYIKKVLFCFFKIKLSSKKKIAENKTVQIIISLSKVGSIFFSILSGFFFFNIQVPVWSMKWDFLL